MMLDLRKIKKPTLVVALGRLVRTFGVPYGSDGKPTLDGGCQTGEKIYLEGAIGLVDPILSKQLDETRKKLGISWQDRAKYPDINPENDPVNVLIMAEHLMPTEHDDGRMRDFSEAAVMTVFNSNLLLPIEAETELEQANEILSVLNNRDIFPNRRESLSIGCICSIIWFLNMATKVYADAPEDMDYY